MIDWMEEEEESRELEESIFQYHIKRTPNILSAKTNEKHFFSTEGDPFTTNSGKGRKKMIDQATTINSTKPKSPGYNQIDKYGYTRYT